MHFIIYEKFAHRKIKHNSLFKKLLFAYFISKEQKLFNSEKKLFVGTRIYNIIILSNIYDKNA